ncbi:hypothetical protein Btru_058015 [Bulinus truncatus]|nr:hypothetical protein Btru_058015 [Bulinus truncatus]
MDPRPPCAFKRSMFNVFCNSHYDITHFTNVAGVDDITHFTNVAGVDDITHFTNVAGVDDITHLTNVAGVDDITHFTNVAGVDDITHFTNVAGVDDITHLTNVAGVDDITHFTNVAGVDDITHFTNVAGVDDITHFTNVAGVEDITHFINVAGVDYITHFTNVAGVDDITHFTNVAGVNDINHFTDVAGVNEINHFTDVAGVNEINHFTDVAGVNDITHFTNVAGVDGIYTSGYAHVGKICDSKLATGVGEFNKTYFTVLTTAHEIGHILGSEHGGPATSSIMSPQLDPTNANRWFFSSCSASDIKSYISSLSSNCLLSTDVNSTKPTVTYGSYTGQMLDPEVICQRTGNDSNSYMCKAWSLYNNLPPSGDRVCSQIFCSVTGTQYCSNAYTSEGMVCDVSKRCKNGKCILDSTAPTNVDSKCVYGDQKILDFKSVGFYNTCQVWVKEKSSITCYQETINQRCCSTCKPYYTGRVGCEYGDKSLDCVQYSKDSVCSEYKDTLCCGYCYGYVPKRSKDGFIVISPDLNLPPILHEPVFAIKDHGKDVGQE